MCKCALDYSEAPSRNPSIWLLGLSVDSVGSSERRCVMVLDLREVDYNPCRTGQAPPRAQGIYQLSPRRFLCPPSSQANEQHHATYLPVPRTNIAPVLSIVPQAGKPRQPSIRDCPPWLFEHNLKTQTSEQIAPPFHNPVGRPRGDAGRWKPLRYCGICGDGSRG